MLANSDTVTELRKFVGALNRGEAINLIELALAPHGSTPSPAVPPPPSTVELGDGELLAQTWSMTWDELSKDQCGAAKKLGYDEVSWRAFKAARPSSLSWDDFSGPQIAAAGTLGIGKEYWDRLVPSTVGGAVSVPAEGGGRFDWIEPAASTSTSTGTSTSTSTGTSTGTGTATGTGTGTRVTTELDQDIIAALMEMGFTQNASQRAAKATNNSSTNEAVEWCFGHNDDPDFNDPLP
eukprot:SAG11_NODE_6702_length_1263_cov_1.052405_1_plen_236_part_10